MRRTAHPQRVIRRLRLLSWAVAVLCLGTWGWAHVDIARFEADAERQLERAMDQRSSAASREAAAIERAVERELGRSGHEEDVGDAPSGLADLEEDGASSRPVTTRPAQTTPAAARVATPTPPGRVGTTELLGRLRIPRIDLSVVVAEGIDRRTLRRAAGRIPGTAPLGGQGNIGIAGHRDGVFRDLSRAASGDLVIIETPEGATHYRIEAISIVGPQATEVLATTDQPTLTLVTCYPFDLLGPAEERWVVRARKVEPASS